MAIHMIGSRGHKGIQSGWVDFIGIQETPGTQGTSNTYTFKMPNRFRRVILIGIGVGGGTSAAGNQTFTGGGGGGGAAKTGVVLPPKDVLTVIVPKSCVVDSNETLWPGYQAPPLVIQSAALGPLITVNAGSTCSGQNPGAGGVAIIHRNDFPVLYGGATSGGNGMVYTGGYEKQYAGSGLGYSGGGGGGGHGNLGGAHGPNQTSAAFLASMANAKQIFGSAVWNKTSYASNAYASKPVQDPCFGGGAGGSNGNHLMPGRAFARIAWGLSNDIGQINPMNTGW